MSISNKICSLFVPFSILYSGKFSLNRILRQTHHLPNCSSVTLDRELTKNNVLNFFGIFQLILLNFCGNLFDGTTRQCYHLNLSEIIPQKSFVPKSISNRKFWKIFLGEKLEPERQFCFECLPSDGRTGARESIQNRKKIILHKRLKQTCCQSSA